VSFPIHNLNLKDFIRNTSRKGE